MPRYTKARRQNESFMQDESQFDDIVRQFLKTADFDVPAWLVDGHPRHPGALQEWQGRASLAALQPAIRELLGQHLTQDAIRRGEGILPFYGGSIFYAYDAWSGKLKQAIIDTIISQGHARTIMGLPCFQLDLQRACGQITSKLRRNEAAQTVDAHQALKTLRHWFSRGFTVSTLQPGLIVNIAEQRGAEIYVTYQVLRWEKDQRVAVEERKYLMQYHPRCKTWKTTANPYVLIDMVYDAKAFALFDTPPPLETQ